MTELHLRRTMCLTPHAFDIVRKACRRGMRRVAIKRDALGRFTNQEKFA